MASVELYLASGSPRRRELLDQIGVRFETIKVDVCEDVLLEELPEEYVARLALEKAKAGWSVSQSLPVLGADTSVIYSGNILGKPQNEEDAIRMLLMLSGETHQVMTAVAVVGGGQEYVRLVTTDVSFRDLSLEQCQRYWATGEPVDKAGSYGIQGYGGLLVTHISGSYSSVVGLPITETAELLKLFNVSTWNARS